MRNLKRTLSLVLAAAMLIGMMVVSASAAGYGDFTDKDKIVNTEAVQILNALGVIDGKEDGSYFDPTGSVTRAEMAKMITIICLGDVDVSAFQGTATDLTDISMWAEAYIKYCYSQGVISGRGNGKFDPTANVTAAEAAKMLLVAIGYNSDVQGYEGSQWAINVTRDAQLSGFYKDVSVPSTQALTRDQAAQMIYNAIQADLIVATPNWNSSTGTVTYTYVPDPTKDLLGETFSAEKKVTMMTDATYNSADKDYDYSFANSAYGVTYTGDDVAGATVTNGLDAAEDYSALVGHKVTVVYSTKTGNPVYGVYAADSVVASSPYYSYAAGDASSGKIKLGGVKYSVEGTNNTVDFYPYNTTSASAPTGVAVAAMVDYIDFDGNGKIDYAVYTPFTVESVTYAGTKSYTLSTTGNKSYDAEDISIYEGVAKDDQVMVVAAANSAKGIIEVTKLDVLSGKVTAVNGNTKSQIDGSWIQHTAAAMALDSSYDYALVNGYAVYVDATSSTVNAEDYVLVAGTQTSAGNGWNGDQVKLVYSDGTIEIKDYDSGVGSQVAIGDIKIASDGNATLYIVDDKDNDGKVELYAVETTTSADTSDDKVGGFDGYIASATYSKAADKSGVMGGDAYTEASGSVTNAAVTGMTIASDAIVFVYNTAKSSCSVITGEELAKLSAATVVNAYFNTSKTTGFSEVTMAFVKSNLVSTTGVEYGYVTGDVIVSKNSDGADVAQVTFWNGTDTVTLYTDTNNDHILTAKGQAFSYKLDGDGNMTEITKLTSADEGAITAYDGTYLTIDGDATKYEVDEDTVIIYVDTEGKAGVEGSTIQLANKDQLGAYIKNVVILDADCDDTLEIIFVDIANDFDFVG